VLFGWGVLFKVCVVLCAGLRGVVAEHIFPMIESIKYSVPSFVGMDANSNAALEEILGVRKILYDAQANLRRGKKEMAMGCVKLAIEKLKGVVI